jgi:hypothetical protein
VTIHNRLRDLSARLSRAFRSRAPKPYHLELDAAIPIRQSDAFDEVALQRLATLEGRKLPEGTFLVAGVDGDAPEPAEGPGRGGRISRRQALEPSRLPARTNVPRPPLVASGRNGHGCSQHRGFCSQHTGSCLPS